MSQWTTWLQERAALRAQRGLVRSDPVLRTSDPQQVLDLASNDYLGLARHPRVVAAARSALEEWGASASASRVVTGTLPVHRELEAALCALTGQPSALAFSTGYAANLGALTALAGRGSQILLDEHAHASLHDAARMSRVPYATFRHSDVADLQARLAERAGHRVLVAVESIYSVLGDPAPLRELADACRRHDALLLVDEAHGIGVAGGGRGLAHELGLAGAPGVLVTATLSKSLGSQGGAVLGPPAIREHLLNTARPFVFDTGLAPAAAGAAAAAARIVQESPELVAAMRRNAASIARECAVPVGAGAVQSIPIGDPGDALAASLTLRRLGVLVGCFRPPSVPDGVSRLRLTARADLSAETLTEALALVRTVTDGYRAPQELRRAPA